MMWMNVTNARLFFGTRIEPRTWAGAVLGSVGIVALFWPAVAAFSWGDAVLKGAALSLGGAFLASLGNMLSKDSQVRGLPIVPSNAWGMLYGMLITAAVAWWRKPPTRRRKAVAENGEGESLGRDRSRAGQQDPLAHRHADDPVHVHLLA